MMESTIQYTIWISSLKLNIKLASTTARPLSLDAEIDYSNLGMIWILNIWTILIFKWLISKYNFFEKF